MGLFIRQTASVISRNTAYDFCFSIIETVQSFFYNHLHRVFVMAFCFYKITYIMQ